MIDCQFNLVNQQLMQILIQENISIIESKRLLNVNQLIRLTDNKYYTEKFYNIYKSVKG